MRKNIAQRIREHANLFPNRVGLIFTSKRFRNSKELYKHITFGELDAQSDAYAYGLQKIGICKGTKTILMVKPGLELYTIVFALFKIGAIAVVVDPGMGIKRMLHCYKTVGADAFIGIPLAHTIRILNPKIFSSLKSLVNVGKQFFFGTHRLVDLAKHNPAEQFPINEISADELIIINFTTGSTGPAKGVEYTYRMADAILNQIATLYHQGRDTISLTTLPLFGIFDLLIGGTSVLPPMDPTKPAKANPQRMLQTIHEFKISHMFASPAFLHRIADYAGKNSTQLCSLQHVISGGAPVSRSVVEAIHAILPQNAFFHITYGSTESLPIASILSNEWLEESKLMSATGKGTCVGMPVQEAEVRIIKICDTPLLKWCDNLQLSTREVGEIVLAGPSVSKSYYGATHYNELMKISEGNTVWHRTGDLGWLDENGRLWFCGRKSDIVTTPQGLLYTEQCEGIFNSHPAVYRSALIGLGSPGNQIPVMCIELKKNQSSQIKKQIEAKLFEIAKQNPLTQRVQKFLFHRSFPVDIRHNAKINRKELTHWAQYKFKSKASFKWLMFIPLAGWLFLFLGMIWPINNIALKVIWWIDVFLSVGLHGMQLFISLPLGKKAGFSARTTVFFTFLLGATWWRLLDPRDSQI